MTAKHNHKMVFGKREAGCPRCAELNAGAPVIKWSMIRAERDARHLADIRAHNCKDSRCGPVCTFGEW